MNLFNDDALLADDRSVASGWPMAKIAAGNGRAPKPFMAAGTRKPLAKDAVWDTSVGIAADQRRAGRAGKTHLKGKTSKRAPSEQEAATTAAGTTPAKPKTGAARKISGSIVVAKPPSRRR